MSLNVKHLNGDTSFLLTFSPFDDRPASPHSLRSSSNFTILLDPWLSACGPSQVYHAKFALTHHNVKSCVDSLADLPPPTVVLISQDKPDHCHETTLRQLDPSLKHTIILAVPAAAKKIRSWKYFDPSKIHSLPVFSEKKVDSIIRFQVPASQFGSAPGEVTIAFIPAKRDMTGLHNALGITYRAPSTASPSDSIPPRNHSSTSQTSDFEFDLPFQGTPNPEAQSHPPSDLYLPPTPPDSPTQSTSTAPSSPDASNPFSGKVFGHHTPSTSFTSSNIPATSLLQVPPPPTFPHLGRPKTLSVIYSPHGVTYPHILPYATTHLILTAALPLTCLLHSFDRVQNPWWLGGNISAGLPGGLEIAQNLLAKCWISAHDEDKDSTGVSVSRTVTKKFGVKEVRDLVERERRGGKVGVDVRSMDVGEEIILRA